MKNKPGYLTLAMLLLTASNIFSQAQPSRYQVAIFTPLYLDSAFDPAANYRYGKNFPKFFNSGLEFYEGAQLAIDSLNKEGLPLDVFLYDTKSNQSSVPLVTSSPQFDSIDLIIGHVNANEARQLANTASKNNVPFINATYPNDAGVSNNPNYIILNSTLFTHFNAMYKFIQKNHALSPIVFFRKKGAAEDRLKSYFDEIGKNTASVPLKIKVVTLSDNFTEQDVQAHLDADRPTVCIAGSLDIGFGEHLVEHLSSLYDNYRSLVFAMPTWWDVTDLTKPEFKDVEVMYTTPFYLSPTNELSISVLNEFKSRFYSRPTDMVFRGYETLYHFAHLLNINGKNLGSGLSDKRYTVFSQFDVQPVINPKTNTLDYFENKKIYFIKKINGVVTAVF